MTTYFIGQVKKLIKGKDGHPGAVYAVYYDAAVAEFIVDHLIEDYEDGAVLFFVNITRHKVLFYLFYCLFVFYVPSTARSFRDGTPIYCPLRRM